MSVDQLRESAGYYKRTKGGADTFADGCHICGRQINIASAQIIYETSAGELCSENCPDAHAFYVGPECSKKLKGLC